MSSKKKNRNPRSKETFPLAKTEHAAVKEWLGTLREDEFRDKVLPVVFKEMCNQKLLNSYKNIHGRNDKGVDFLIFENAPLGQRTVGIQVKSCEMTRASGPNSAVQVKRECEAAMEHEFTLDSKFFKLDQIELWNSGHITEDAEAELRSPGSRIKIPIKHGDDLVLFIENYAPKLLNSIPQYSVLLYINTEKSRSKRTFSLFGQRLNPQEHFLEPKFTPGSQVGLESLKSREGKLQPKPSKNLNEILDNYHHIVITGQEMSGKSYCLERIFGTIREKKPNSIPVYFEEDEVPSLKSTNLMAKIGAKVCGFSVRQIEALTEENQIVILCDRIDRADKQLIEYFAALEPKSFRIIGSACAFQGGDKFSTFNISGVSSGSITSFIRKIDCGLTASNSFTDRAVNYVNRALGALGLPATPFVVAACLRECHANNNDLNTPTFGRLVSRFVEEQAGGRNDFLKVDHEAKDSVLKEISAINQRSIAIEDLKSVIESYISRSGSPHQIESFISDFEYSGLIEVSRDSKLARWCHPIYLKYYWLRYSLDNNDDAKVIEILKKRSDPTLSALFASSLHNCDLAIDELLGELNQLSLPSTLDFMEVLEAEGIFFPDEDNQEHFFDSIEKMTVDEMNIDAESNTLPREVASTNTPPRRELTKEEKEKAKKHMEFLISRLHEEKFSVASNLSSILVNGRGTSLTHKIKVIRALFQSNARFGRIISEFAHDIFNKDKPSEKFKSHWTVLFFELYITDRSIGDTYLREVFREVASQDLTEEEKVMILDLQASCGAISDEDFINEVKAIGKLEVTLVLHLRLILLYYFRFQKPEEKKRLRNLLTELSKIHRGFNLGKLVPAAK